jgi:hypothetical protein
MATVRQFSLASGSMMLTNEPLIRSAKHSELPKLPSQLPEELKSHSWVYFYLQVF